MSWEGGHGQTVTIVADGFSIILSDDDFGCTLLGWICNDRLTAPPYRLWVDAVSEFLGRPSIGEAPLAVRLDQKKEWVDRLICEAVYCVEQLVSSPSVWFDAVRAYDEKKNRG